MDLSSCQDLAETFAQAFHRFIEKQVKGNCNGRVISSSVNWHFTGFQSGLYFCAEIPEPLFRGMVAVKGVAADTDAQTDARTTRADNCPSRGACVRVVWDRLRAVGSFLSLFLRGRRARAPPTEKMNMIIKVEWGLVHWRNSVSGTPVKCIHYQLKVTLEDYP